MKQTCFENVKDISRKYFSDKFNLKINCDTINEQKNKIKINWHTTGNKNDGIEKYFLKKSTWEIGKYW